MTTQSNAFTVTLTDGREILFSYGVPVAAFIPRDYVTNTGMISTTSGYIKMERRYSRTTSKHVNAYCAFATEVDDMTFQRLISPIAPKGR